MGYIFYTRTSGPPHYVMRETARFSKTLYILSFKLDSLAYISHDYSVCISAFHLNTDLQNIATYFY